MRLQEPATHHFIRRRIFRIFLLAIAIFAGILLLSLNVVYIIYILLLPPLPSQLASDGDNCVQRKAMKHILNQPALQITAQNLNFDHVQSIWFMLATPEPIFLSMTFFFCFNLMYNLISLFIPPSSKKQLMSKKRRLVIAYTQHIPTADVERYSDQMYSMTLLLSCWNMLIFLIIPTWLYFHKTGSFHDQRQRSSKFVADEVRCLRLIDTVQIASALLIGLHHQYSCRISKLLLKEFYSTNVVENNINNNTKHIFARKNAQNSPSAGKNNAFASLIYSIIIEFIYDPINVIGVSIFSTCCILKIGEDYRDQFAQILDGNAFFRALLAENECACTVSAGCPLEHFIFAEFVCISSISYIWHNFKLWHGLTVQRHYISEVYSTIGKEEKSALMSYLIIFIDLLFTINI